MALGRQISWKPGQEEHQRGVARKLADGGAEDLPLAHEEADVAPLETRRRVALRESAAGRDVVQLRLVDPPARVGIAIDGNPGERKHNTGDAHYEKQRAPAPRGADPEQNRAEKGKAKVLSDRVHTRRARSFVLWKPGAEDATVAGEGGRLGDTQGEAGAEERGKTRRESL